MHAHFGGYARLLGRLEYVFIEKNQDSKTIFQTGAFVANFCAVV